MSFYSRRGWAPYVTVAERRRKAESVIKKLRKNGAMISPVEIDGRKIAKAFWGKAWCDNLESYRDYENRLERGRSYVCNGLVLDLQIAPREVRAMVSGSELYHVKISIAEIAKTAWKQLCADCAGGIDSLVELLQGRFSQAVMQRICKQDTGLFPHPAEIRFTCDCPDYATMCKHVAAALYGVGARLDESPEMMFTLRGVEAADLLCAIGTALPAAKAQRDQTQSLADAELTALFELEMAGDDPDPAPIFVKPSRTATAPRKRAATQASAAKPAIKTKSETETRVGKPKQAKPATKAQAKPTRVSSKIQPKPVKQDEKAKAAPGKFSKSSAAKIPANAKAARAAPRT